jgi:hypothetical protein
MVKLISKRLKDQTALAFVPVLIVAGLIITGLGLWSVGTEAKKTIDKKEPLYKYAMEENTKDAEAYQEQINKAMVLAAVEGGKVAIGTVAGVHDTYLTTTALDAAGAFDTEKRKTAKLDKLDPPPASEDEINRLMQLTEDELDRIVEEVGAMDMIDPATGKEIDFNYSDEEINRLLEETGKLDYGIEKMVKKKVDLNSGLETTPQEKKDIVDETIKNIKKADDSNNKVDLNSWVQTILKGAEKLADQKLIDLRKELARNQLSSDYNTGIVEKYEEYQAKGQGISDTSELAEAKKRLADLYDETKIIETQIKELEDAQQITKDSTISSESEEAKGLTGADKGEADTKPTETTAAATQPTETAPETTPGTELPSELNLKGTISSSEGFYANLTLYINFETQNISGKISYKGLREWETFEMDENGNKIPGTEKTIMRQTTIKGTINGKIDINSKTINGTVSESVSAYAEEQKKDLNESFSYTISGSLNESNNASGSTSDGYVWSASPN